MAGKEGFVSRTWKSMKSAIKERLRGKGKKKLYDLSKLGAAPTDTTVSPYSAQGGATLGSRIRQYNASEERKAELKEFYKKQARIKKLTRRGGARDSTKTR